MQSLLYFTFEVHNVTVLDHVGSSFLTHLLFVVFEIFAEFFEIIEGYGFSRDEALLEIGMDSRGSFGSERVAFDVPGSDFIMTDCVVLLEVESFETGVDNFVEGLLWDFEGVVLDYLAVTDVFADPTFDIS